MDNNLEKRVNQRDYNQEWYKDLLIQQFNKEPEPRTFLKKLIDFILIR